MDILYANIVQHFLGIDGRLLEIAEPVGFDAAKFVIKQDDKRYGRDVSFAPAELTFYSLVDVGGLTHRFDDIIEAYRINGFESDTKYVLRIDGIDYIIGQLDFNSAKTDEYTYFTTDIIQENNQAIVKRRFDVDVDLFSREDLDGNPIEPLQPKKIYLRATPETQRSEWAVNSVVQNETDFPDNSVDLYHNPMPIITKDGIEDAFSPNSFIDFDTAFDKRDYVLINAANRIKNLKIDINGLYYNIKQISGGGTPFDIQLKIYFQVGDFDFGSAEVIYDSGFSSIELDIVDVNVSIPEFTLERDESVYLVFDVRIENIADGDGVVTFLPSQGNITAIGSSISISSVIDAFNLGEAMQHVVKSISGLDTIAPRFLGGEFKDQYITNGLLIRNIIDEPFYLSMEKIMDYLPELNGDYQVNDNSVSFGIYDDFYADENIGEFLMLPDETFTTSFNPRYSINTFSFQYDKYEKENDQEDSREGVHTSMKMLAPNKFTNNSKDVTVSFARDTFLLESTRKEAILVTDSVATKEDETIFIIDAIQKEFMQDAQSIQLRHVIEGTNLKLINDGSFNWSFLGFSELQIIFLIGENAGQWVVGDIGESSLTLFPTAVDQATYNGITRSTIVYEITQTDITNRTDEGFLIIEGIKNTSGFSNLRFTPKRNTWFYWGRYLATATTYRREATDRIRVTEFIHNGNLITKFETDGLLQFKEDADINPSILNLGIYEKAILSPKSTTTKVICDFQTFWDFREKLRNIKGYANITDNNGNTLKVHAQETEYFWKDNYLEITGEIRA